MVDRKEVRFMTMQVTVKGRNIEVTPALREYVEKKMAKFERMLEDITEAVVTLSSTKGNDRVELTVPLRGIVLRCEEETDDMYTSMDLVVEKLERQVRKYKTKLAKKTKTVVKPSMDDIVPIEEEEAPVKVKKFPAKPLSVDEAIMQMNLSGHTFFAFTNQDTGKINVVYARRDGKYGLLEPEI